MRLPALFANLFISALLLDSAGAAAAADSPGGLFQQGNAHYQNGDFAAAERCYRQILEPGKDSSTVYYNLGNACFKQKRLGEAIYYWEKARRMLPGDLDVRQNLEVANGLIIDRIEVPEDALPVRLAASAAHLFTVAQESRIVIVLFLLINVFVSIHLLTRIPRLAYWALTATLATALLMLLFSASLTWKVYRQHYDREGVIVEQKVDVRSGPGQENVAVVTVHEGIIVQIRNESNGWFQISLPNGWNGWLPGSSVRIL